MPRGDAYMATLIGPGANRAAVRGRILTNVEAASLSAALHIDAADSYYSGWVSFLDGIRGVEKGFYSWATVKMYYSVFYAFRASLAIDDICAFHNGRSQYTVVSRAGASPASCSARGSHKAVMEAFENRNAGHVLLSQQIDLQGASDWLMEKRETANYGRGRFIEPSCGSEFDFVVDTGVRRAINAYLEGSTPMYVFDRDHAMVAYPLKTLGLVGDQLLGAGMRPFANDEQDFLKASARDRTGALPGLVAEMRRVGIVE
jgi:hypothetical protein